MKYPFRSKILPLFTILAGAVGFALRLWLFSAIDHKALLPAGHPAGTILFILTALVLGILFLTTRRIDHRPIPEKAQRFIAFTAYLLGGVGLILTGLTDLSVSAAKLALLATIASLAGGVAMIWMGLLKCNGKALPYGLPAVLTMVLMLDTVAQCQTWGAVAQVQVYFFPLLASVFLILTAYHKTLLTAGRGKPSALAFFSQGAMFFCFLSLNTNQWPLYGGMLFWSAVQIIPTILSQKEA